MVNEGLLPAATASDAGSSLLLEPVGVSLVGVFNPEINSIPSVEPTCGQIPAPWAPAGPFTYQAKVRHADVNGASAIVDQTVVWDGALLLVVAETANSKGQKRVDVWDTAQEQVNSFVLDQGSPLYCQVGSTKTEQFQIGKSMVASASAWMKGGVLQGPSWEASWTRNTMTTFPYLTSVFSLTGSSLAENKTNNVELVVDSESMQPLAAEVKFLNTSQGRSPFGSVHWSKGSFKVLQTGQEEELMKNLGANVWQECRQLGDGKDESLVGGESWGRSFTPDFNIFKNAQAESAPLSTEPFPRNCTQKCFTTAIGDAAIQQCYGALEQGGRCDTSQW